MERILDTRLTDCPPGPGLKPDSPLVTLSKISDASVISWVGKLVGIPAARLEQHYRATHGVHHGSLGMWVQGLLSARLSVVGFGEVRRERLRVALKLAEYLAFVDVSARPTLSSPQDCEYFLRQHFMCQTHEVFCGLFLNSRNHLLACEDLFMGTIDSAAVYPREVAAKALETGASSVIVAHNHPSGCPRPSQADRQITDRLRNALAILDISLLDHIIIGRGRAHSMAASGDV